MTMQTALALLMAARPELFGQKAYDGDAEAHGDVLVKASHAELHVKEDGEPGEITGYGSVFEKVDSYGEMVMPGAFSKSLKRWKAQPIPMLWQHRSDQPIGVWDTYSEDAKGLKVEGRINLETQRGLEAWSDIKMKAVRGLSIGFFEIKADPWDWGSTEPRKLIELDLREVSPVTFPALREAQIDKVKARLARGGTLQVREFEGFLREKLNLSRSDAEEIANLGYKAWLHRDGVGGGDDNALADELRAMRSQLGTLELPQL